MLHYLKSGSGFPLVLLHGFCENHACFTNQARFLQDHFQVITLDLPGFGESSPLPHWSMESMAEELNRFLDELHVESCILFGHSMGGYITLAFAEQFPGRLKGFGLIHSTAAADSEDRREKRRQVIRFIEENGKEAYINSFLPGMFRNPLAHEADVAFLKSHALKGSSEGITDACVAMMKRSEKYSLLSESSLPVFFAVGGHDTFIDQKDVLRQAALCAQADLCMLESSAHIALFEEPEKLNGAMKIFADRVLAS